MTVPTTSTRSGPYYPNGATLSFPFGFRALEKDDVQVVRVGSDGVEVEVSSALYNVTLSDNGGAAVFASAPVPGNPLYVQMSPSFLQEISLENEGAFLPEVITEALDRSAQRALFLRDQVARSFQIPIAGDVAGKFPVVLPGGKPGFASGTGNDPNLRTDLALNGGAYIGVPPLVTDEIVRSLLDFLNENFLTPERFGAVGDGVADDTVPFQKMITRAMQTGRPCQLPPKVYRITSTLTVGNEIRMIGSGTGSNYGTTILNDGAGVLFNITVPVGESIIGLDMGHFIVSTPGSYTTGYGYGGAAFYITTAPGYTIHNSRWHHIRVLNHQVGFDFGGVFYQNKFEQIFVTSSPVLAPLPMRQPLAGFRTNAFYDITYNSFYTLEVTNVGNGGYAYNISSHWSDFTQLTCDGPGYFNCPGGTARNITCEAWTPEPGTSPQSMVFNFTNFAKVDSVAIRAVPNSRADIGVFMGGQGWALMHLNINPGSPGNPVSGQPNAPLYLDGKGLIVGGVCVDAVNKLGLTGDGQLNGTIAINADAFTDFGLSGSGTLRSAGANLGFFTKAPTAKPTGVAVTAEGIHAALVSLGLIAA